MKVDKSMALAIGAGAGIAYFLDTFGTVGDVAAGTLAGWVLGHPVLGGAAAFLMPSRRTIRGLLDGPGGRLGVVQPPQRSGGVTGGLGYQAPRDAAAKPIFKKWARDQSNHVRGWYDTTGSLHTESPKAAGADPRGVFSAQAKSFHDSGKAQAQAWFQEATRQQALGNAEAYSAALLEAERANSRAESWGRYV